MEINNQPNEEFKLMGIKMLTKLRGRVDEHGENFNRENVRKYQSELKYIITEMKNILDGMKSRADKIYRMDQLSERQGNENHTT